jgi:hypothetical protein
MALMPPVRRDCQRHHNDRLGTAERASPGRGANQPVVRIVTRPDDRMKGKAKVRPSVAYPTVNRIRSIGRPAGERVAQQREFARQLIAVLIVGSLFVIVVFSYLSLWYKKDGMIISDITGVLDKLISPVVGIVGAVTGFYFGERQRQVTAQATTNE